MELRRLRAFVALAEEGSFTRAAVRLHVSQPGLSTQIQSFERELGVQLIDRSARAIRLTDAGRFLYAEGRRIVETYDDTVELLRRAGSAELGRLTVGFIPLASNTVLPTMVRRFSHDHPGIATRLREMPPDELVRALHDRTIDIAIMFRPFDDAALRTWVITTESFVVAVPARHRLSDRDAVDLSELRDEPFVLPARHGRPGLHEKVLEVCSRAGFIPRPVQDDVWLVQTIMGLVAAGTGIALLPASVRTMGRVGITYLDLEPNDAESHIELVAAWSAEGASPATDAFVTTLKTA